MAISMTMIPTPHLPTNSLGLLMVTVTAMVDQVQHWLVINLLEHIQHKKIVMMVLHPFSLVQLRALPMVLTKTVTMQKYVIKMVTMMDSEPILQ